MFISHDPSKETYLQFIVRLHDYDEVKKMLKEGVDVNYTVEDCFYPIELAISNKDYKIVKLLLENGAYPDSPKYFDNILCLACSLQQPSIVKLLCEYGANVNARNKEGATPLILSTIVENTEQVYILLEHNADPNIKDTKNQTALDYTFMNIRCADIKKLLLEHGAKQNIFPA